MSTGPTRNAQTGQPFVDAEVKSFEKALGWYLWTWKMEAHTGMLIGIVVYMLTSILHTNTIIYISYITQVMTNGTFNTNIARDRGGVRQV